MRVEKQRDGESHAEYQKRWRTESKEHLAAAQRAKRIEAPEKHRALTKRYRQEHPECRHAEQVAKYGLKPVEYAAMLEAQGGKRALCPSGPKPNRRLAVDHCHNTGKVRALLCDVCNKHLGVFERRAAEFAEYIKKYQQEPSE